ncbi:MAG: PilN domain-containing protein [Gaiellaceae bacterium]
MRAVNLLPKETRAARRADPVAFAAGGGAAVVIAALALGVLSAGGGLSDKRDRVAAAEAQLGLVAAPDTATAPDDAALAEEQGLRSTAVQAALSTRVSWDRVLRRFSLVLPEDVWLTTLSATGSEAGGAGALFQIQGYTYSHDAVARLLARLSLLPDLTNVQLQRSALAPLAGREVVEFSIAAGIRRGVTS